MQYGIIAKVNLFEFQLYINHLKKISSKLKQRFSVGGSVKNQTIIIQGNIRDKVMNYLSEIGFTVKRVGG